ACAAMGPHTTQTARISPRRIVPPTPGTFPYFVQRGQSRMCQRARCAWRGTGSRRTVRGTPSTTDTVELVSFDGGVTATCRRWRPEAGEAIESLGTGAPRIARGGGYSYAAASFGADSLVVDMTRFDRVLAFDAPTHRVVVGGGIPR